MKLPSTLLRCTAACVFVFVALADVAFAQSPPPPPPPPPPSSGGYPPSHGYPQSGYPPAQSANEGAGIRREMRTRFAVGTQLGAAMNYDWEKWLGGQVSMYKPLSYSWHVHIDLFYGFMSTSRNKSYRLGDSYVDNYHDVETDVFGARLMLGYWFNDVVSFRFGAVGGLAGGYTYTGYCGERDADGKPFGPSVALGFHGWHPFGGGAWEFALQVDQLFEMPYSTCVRSYDDTYDQWYTHHFEPRIITAQGLYYF